jgi:hypothetical protein
MVCIDVVDLSELQWWNPKTRALNDAVQDVATMRRHLLAALNLDDFG